MNTTLEQDFTGGEYPLGIILSILSRKYAGALSLSLDACGTDRYVSIMLLVGSLPKPVNQQFLVDQLSSDKASMVRKLDYLCERNLLRRTVNPLNRREYLLELTTTGKKKLPLIRKAVKRMNDIALADLSGSARSSFMKTLGKVAANLEAVPSRDVRISYKISDKISKA
jgi:DNA-binding MarR family transcriptional regulator